MTWEAIAYMLGLIVAGLLMFASVWFLVQLNDLESDYINPIDLCNSLNQWVVPEVFLHSGLFAMFAFNSLWVPALINLPMLVWNINKMANGTQNYEATQIFRNLPTYKKEGLIKIGFYLLSFFFYLFGMVMGLINENVTAV